MKNLIWSIIISILILQSCILSSTFREMQSTEGYQELVLLTADTIYHNSIDNHNDEDVIPISKREYLLYCYIFAIRNKNLEAAAEFFSYYLDDLYEKRIALDTNMFMTVKNMASQVLSDTCNSYHLSKFIVAESLQRVYRKIFKDTVMEKQYNDSVSKYLELMKLMK